VVVVVVGKKEEEGGGRREGEGLVFVNEGLVTIQGFTWGRRWS